MLTEGFADPGFILQNPSNCAISLSHQATTLMYYSDFYLGLISSAHH